MKTAVILAARKEQDASLPYPLQCYNIGEEKQESLLIRTISLLQEMEFDTIIVVTGFCAELFLPFKEEGVQLVHNERYVYTSSMASLALAAPYVKEDFLLIESDVLCEKRLLKQLATTSKKNCLTLVNECGNGDEALVETDGDFVVKISKDIHQLNRIDGEMVGISKISLETYKKMLVKWEFNSNLKLNYEYLFLDCTEKYERQYIKAADLVWCEVDNAVDFASLKDVFYPKLRRKEDPFDYQNIISHLRTIFPKQDFGTTLSIEQIGGMTNRNFKVSFEGNNYVLRIPGIGTEGMVERGNEEVNTLLTYRMGISPEIFYFSDNTGIKLTRFIDGAETLTPATIQRYEHIVQIADIFRALHNSSIRLNNDFNVFREIISYENLLDKAGAKMYDGYEKYRSKIFCLQERLNVLGVELKPCHNDLVAENFIKDIRGKIYLIDWEYSGMNDPMWDIAALFLESNFDETNKTLLLEHYLGGSVNDVLNEKILIYQILMDILWSIWTCIKEAQGDDFGTYGIDRYNRAISNLDRFAPHVFNGKL